MAFCQNCGNELKEGARFCENCGAAVEIVPEPVQTDYQNTVYEEPAVVGPTPEQASASKSALIFSIIGLALAEFGIPGIIFSAIAKGKVKNAEALGVTGGKVKAARILSKIGMILSIVMTVFWVLYIVFFGMMFGVMINEGAFDEIANELSYLN